MYAARIFAMITAIPIHESAHAWVSSMLGDPTAKNLGRISLNPMKHFDVMGTMCLLLLGFGWAKPVPVDSRYYTNRKAGMAMSSIAGPLANFLLAFFFMIISKILYYLYAFTSPSAVIDTMRLLCDYSVLINIVLMVFNMLPVPPLDGSRIFLIFLPERMYFEVMKAERYIMFILFALIWTGVLNRPLAAMQSSVLVFLDTATRFIDVVMRLILAPSATAIL